jgi:vancomycin resistance protein YoaR
MWLGVAAVLGLALGFMSIPTSSEPRGEPPERFSLYGRELAPSRELADIAQERAGERFRGWFNLVLPDGTTRPISYAALGAQPDRTRLRRSIAALLAGRGNPRAAPRSGVELVVPVELDRDRAAAALLALKDELDQLASDAHLNLDLQAIVPERPGRLLDLDRSLNAIERAMERGEDRAALAFDARRPARVSTDLASIRHDALLGYFETRLESPARAPDRTFNLQLAASRLDGHVLMPGETFDFNTVVGPRDEANGYRVASVLAEGELVDGTGGGTSQISGTLHAAALFAGLSIVERHCHPRPSAYIDLGLDAAVAYPAINLRIANPYDFPVVLRATVAKGRIRAEVRGARRPYAISIVRKIDAATPFEQTERPDASLPRGTRALAQRGVPGIELHRYRIRRDGAHARRQVVVDHYPPTPQIVLVGTGEGTLTIGRPPIDAAPEYLADELLVMTQTEKLDGPLVEQRVAGRFGMPGWTKNIGAPAWIFAAEERRNAATSPRAAENLTP